MADCFICTLPYPVDSSLCPICGWPRSDDGSGGDPVPNPDPVPSFPPARVRELVPA